MARGTCENAVATSRALSSSTSRSSPKILTTTWAVAPATVSSMRSVRNGVIANDTPENSASRRRILSEAASAASAESGFRSTSNSLQ